MKRLWLIILFAAVVAFLPILALADGCFFSSYSYHLNEPSQKAIITWDGHTEEMLLSAAVRADALENFAWVVPVQSKFKPEVEEGNFSVFEDVLWFFDIREDYGMPEGLDSLMIGGKGGGVEVVEQKEIDIYDITILKATSAADLIDWLDDNNYMVPDTAEPILQEYCDRPDFYFVALKVDLKNEHASTLFLLKNKFDITAPCSYVENYGMGGAYSYLWDEINESKLTDMEYEDVWELNAACEALEIGASTPIKLRFVPEEPIFPLAISSINEGYTLIETYVVADTPVEDKTGTLAVSMVEPTDAEIEATLKANFGIDEVEYITRLSYEGELGELTADAVFVGDEYTWYERLQKWFGRTLMPILLKVVLWPIYVMYYLFSY